MNLGDILFLAVGAVLIFLIGTHGYAGIIAASWVPTRRKDYGRIIKALEGIEGGVIADLGCGGGGVMRAIARAYPEVSMVGYEISIPAWIMVRLVNTLSGLSTRCSVHWKNFYQEDLSRFDAVYCFLTPMAMKKLKPKFERELKPTAIVISYAFFIPGWKGERITQDSSAPLFRYIRKDQP
ncbi:MAG: class I SAM-dependent methyltransferase [Patescibacteria group bacterium]